MSKTLIHDMRSVAIASLIDNSDSMAEHTDGFVVEEYVELLEGLYEILEEADPWTDYEARLKSAPEKLRDYVSDQIEYHMTEGWVDEQVLDERKLLK